MLFGTQFLPHEMMHHQDLLPRTKKNYIICMEEHGVRRDISLYSGLYKTRATKYAQKGENK